jgi:hypothetical protein
MYTFDAAMRASKYGLWVRAKNCSYFQVKKVQHTFGSGSVFVVLLVIFSISQGFADTLKGSVSKVRDGDTIVVGRTPIASPHWIARRWARLLALLQRSG